MRGVTSEIVTVMVVLPFLLTRLMRGVTAETQWQPAGE